MLGSGWSKLEQTKPAYLLHGNHISSGNLFSMY